MKQKISQEDLWAALKSDDTKTLERYGEVMALLSYGLRGAIIAPKGKVLYVADYAAIEARVVMWLAGEKHALQMFRDGVDIYLDMADTIYRKQCNKVDHPQERQLGKATILGAGFGMGATKFVTTAATYGVIIDEEFAATAINTYRTKYARVKRMWYEQESAAVEVVETGRAMQCGKVRWLIEDRFLYCQLPSGRRLTYPDPEIRSRQTPWGEPKPSLTFMGIDGYSHKWKRQHTYGGSLVENITQACARDVMAEAMTRCEDSGVYKVVLSVHDEIIAEAKAGTGSVLKFERLLTTLPGWAAGMPVAAEGWTGTRYRK